MFVAVNNDARKNQLFKGYADNFFLMMILPMNILHIQNLARIIFSISIWLLKNPNF